MTFDLQTVAKSLADYLAPYLPGVRFYEDPNQQGSQPPMLFLQLRFGRLYKELGGYWVRHLGLDLVYLLDYNLPDLQQQYIAAGETLDQVLDTFPYSDGEETHPLQCLERSWEIDLDALHYKFELRERVTLPAPETPTMQTLELHQTVKEADHGQ